MKKIGVILGIAIISVAWAGNSLAAPANHIVISEVQTGSTSDASQEFVELYNPTDAPITVDAWTVEYASAAGTTWTKRATLSGSVPAYGFYLVATSGYMASDAVMTSGLANSSGHVRVKNTSNMVIDLVGWGSAAHAEGSPASAPVVGGSIERLPGRLNQLAGNGEDSDGNSVDFVLRDVAEPQRVASGIEDPSLAPVDEQNNSEEGEGPVVDTTYLPVYITEILPDPLSPLTDAKDEFIEVYNPNNQSVKLLGYTLRTGSNFRSYYTISDVTVQAGGYAVFYSADTKLGLTNSGGAVQILDPLGNVLDTTDSYGAAKTGQAWAAINGAWMWTLTPTPGTMNILAEAASTTSTVSTTAKKAAAKKVATKKTASKKAAAKKSSKAKSKRDSSKLSKTSMAAATEAITDPSPLARWLLIAAGCFTIVYAIYGFRYDLYNYYIKTRTNIRAWLSNRPTLPWRRNH